MAVAAVAPAGRPTPASSCARRPGPRLGSARPGRRTVRRPVPGCPAAARPRPAAGPVTGCASGLAGYDGGPRRPGGRGHVETQPVPSFRLPVAQSTGPRGGRARRGRTVPTPAVLARLPPPGPGGLPGLAARRLPSGPTAMAARSRRPGSLAIRADRHPHRGCGHAPAALAKAGCTTGPDC